MKPLLHTNERPVLFLDVDGVLNAHGNGDYPRYETEGGPVWVPEGTADRVSALLEVYDLHWATAWRGDAHRVWSRLLNLDGLPAPYLDYYRWKLVEIVRAAGERRWAWVDDDAGWELEGLGWTESHVSGLIVIPDSDHGLTDAHVEQLLAFAAGAVPHV